MVTRKIADARQSQLVTTYGVGSLFPAADQSFMIMGTDYWDDRAPRIDEPRLARALGVSHFRTPPAGRRAGDVPVTRFPLQHYCSKCHRLGRLQDLADDDSLWCKRCDDVRLIPSRFVACCESGHIEDFPYWAWAHQGAGGATSDEHRLSLRVLGKSSSLSDIVVACTCGAIRSMAGSFGKESLLGVTRCHGRRPWLETDDQECDRPLRALQRGSSNVWFASMRSTISIPPWSTAAAAFVEKHWALLQHLPSDAVEGAVASMVGTTHPGVTVEGVQAVIARRHGVFKAAAPSESELRADEYTALCAGTGTGTALDNFVCEAQDVAESLSDVIHQVSSVGRLREVRALDGFSRVTPHVPAEDRKLAPLSEVSATWLPATEVHGEGVFMRLREDVLAEWETTPTAAARVGAINGAQRRRDIALERPESAPVTARFVALHSLAHILLDEMSLHAGYPAASLRERIYAGIGQAGILIYTASSDSAGSLGGLAALAAEEQFHKVFSAGIERAAWCSSDPVCAESRGAGADSLNLAACHACLLLPETSCENGNVFLDRVSVVGSTESPDAGLVPAEE